MRDARGRGHGRRLKARDGAAGGDGAEAVLEAIRTSDLVLLVFSASANASPDVLYEVERAVAWERRVVPVRIDDSAPNSLLWRYLEVAAPGSAIPPPDVPQEPDPDPAAAPVKKRRLSRQTWGMVAGGAVIALALSLGLGLGLGLTGHRGTWTALNPSGPEPPPRACAAMAYDEVTQRLIVFSGGDETKNFDDTWAYDPVADTWTELRPSGTLPVRRMYASMTYDPITRRLIMFGGVDAETGACLNDTWAYDPVANSWTELEAGGLTLPVVVGMCWSGILPLASW